MNIADRVTQSFVYRSSTRQSSILAAVSDPVNTELVTQLVRYLDDEYTQPVKHTSEANPEPMDTSEPNVSDIDNMDMMSDGPGPNNMSLASMFGDDMQESEPAPDPEIEPDAEPDVEFGTEVQPEPEITPEPEVQSSVSIESLDRIAANIVTELNQTVSTSGVRASSIKEDELWIYYNDAVNLDNLMEPVIASVQMHNLEFNRLARSRNAIVFTLR